jgi:hypothetical protein
MLNTRVQNHKKYLENNSMVQFLLMQISWYFINMEETDLGIHWVDFPNSLSFVEMKVHEIVARCINFWHHLGYRQKMSLLNTGKIQKKTMLSVIFSWINVNAEGTHQNPPLPSFILEKKTLYRFHGEFLVCRCRFNHFLDHYQMLRGEFLKDH